MRDGEALRPRGVHLVSSSGVVELPSQRVCDTGAHNIHYLPSKNKWMALIPFRTTAVVGARWVRTPVVTEGKSTAVGRFNS